MVVTPTSGLVTTESGGTAGFTVKLDTAPTANVVIPVASGNAAEGRASVSALTFTPANWSTAQTVTVTGADDAALDGDVAYTILLGPATSADPDYNRLDPSDVSATNQDNDFVTTTFPKTVNLSIPDLGTRTSVLNVTAAGTILDLDLKVSITHTSDADLDVFLIAPDGTRVELFTDVGGTGDNFSGTVLDGAASASIAAGTAPFAGTYRPEGNLALLEGKNLSGNWTLEVTDDAKNNTGTLASWSLIVRYAPAGLQAASIGAASPGDAPLTAAQPHKPSPRQVRGGGARRPRDSRGGHARRAGFGSAFGRTLTLDAVGHGWFLDPTPGIDENSSPAPRRPSLAPAPGRVPRRPAELRPP